MKLEKALRKTFILVLFKFYRKLGMTIIQDICERHLRHFTPDNIIGYIRKAQDAGTFTNHDYNLYIMTTCQLCSGYFTP